MIIAISIAILFIFFIYSFEVFRNFTTAKLISTFGGALVFYLLLYNVTYNSDWDIYSTMFNNSASSNDFLFNFISKLFSARRLEYSSVYKFHIFLMGIGFIYFTSRFSYSSVFAVIITYLLFQLIPLSNQIRYYVAFSFYLISVYNLIVAKNVFGFTIFEVLSLLSHSGILLMYPFIYFYYITKSTHYFQKLISYGLIFAGLIFIFYLVGLVFLNHFSSYFEQDGLSSFKGGVFSNAIWLLWSLVIYFKNKRLSKSYADIINYDIKYQFLYKLSLYSVIFYPVSIIVQIFSHRYIVASLIVWVTFILYSLKFENSLFKRLNIISIFLLLNLVTFIYMYFLPAYILGLSGNDIAVELFMANPVFFFLFI